MMTYEKHVYFLKTFIIVDLGTYTEFNQEKSYLYYMLHLMGTG